MRPRQFGCNFRAGMDQRLDGSAICIGTASVPVTRRNQTDIGKALIWRDSRNQAAVAMRSWTVRSD